MFRIVGEGLGTWSVRHLLGTLSIQHSVILGAFPGVAPADPLLTVRWLATAADGLRLHPGFTPSLILRDAALELKREHRTAGQPRLHLCSQPGPGRAPCWSLARAAGILQSAQASK